MDVENQRNSGSSVGKSSGIAGFTGSSTVGCILRNNSVALMPYGIGLLILTIARLKENNDSLIRKILFCLGLVLIAALPVLPALGGIF